MCSMATDTLALERLKAKERKRERAAQREERLWKLLEQPAILQPLAAVAGCVLLQQLGQKRVINRDFAGFLLAAWVAYQASQAGIKDKYALGAITAAATAAYSVSTPPNADETIVELNPSKMLGGDGKLFWWDLPVLGEQG